MNTASNKALRILVLLGLSATTMISVSAQAATSVSSPAASRTWHAAPEGTAAAACTARQPCTVQGALDRATGGDQVVLADGSYGDLRLNDNKRRLVSAKHNVTLRPAQAGRVQVNAVDVYASHVTVDGFRVSDGIRLQKTAEHSVVENVVVDGGSARGTMPAVHLAASHTQLLNSTVGNKTDRDVVFVGSGGYEVNSVRVVGNTIGPGAVGDKGGHVDCLQIGTGAADVQILNNRMSGCSNSAVFIKADSGPISNVTVANNFLQGCLERTKICAGYYALYVATNERTRQPMSDINVLHNSIDGRITVDGSIPRLKVHSNIIGLFLPGVDRCGPWLQYNLLEDTGCRKTLSSTNKVGPARYQDRSRNDLRLRPDSAAIGLGAPSLPSADLYGQERRQPGTSGAHELQAVAPMALPAPDTSLAAAGPEGNTPNAGRGDGSANLSIQVLGPVGAVADEATAPKAPATQVSPTPPVVAITASTTATSSEAPPAFALPQDSGDTTPAAGPEAEGDFGAPIVSGAALWLATGLLVLVPAAWFYLSRRATRG